MFLDSVALKTQLTSKWTGSDIVKGEFPNHISTVCDG